jgi:inhibitor of KinA sporulation pathway (predicted exonuclease)
MERFAQKDQFSFSEALAQSGLEFVGRPHSGLDDARMTALLAHKLHKDGAFFRITKDMNHYAKLNRPF